MGKVFVFRSFRSEDRVIGLKRSVCNSSYNVFALKIGVIFKKLMEAGPLAQRLENIADAKCASLECKDVRHTAGEQPDLDRKNAVIDKRPNGATFSAPSAKLS